MAVQQLARRRRRWYATHPALRRTLESPVISVGNVGLGGSGKTPAVIHLARLLTTLGERPSILSRGYGRRCRLDGVVVVSDATGIRADLKRSGDEPLMIARHLPGVPVLVADDRYLAGRLAECHLNCTVHLLDDGFQHLRLARAADLVMLSRADLDRARTAGREALEAADSADAILLHRDLADRVDEVRHRLPHPRLFHAEMATGEPHVIEPWGHTIQAKAGTRVHVVAAIARPERFVAAVETAGFIVTGRQLFRDHRPFSPADVRRMVQASEATGAEMVLTTEKDVVRLLQYRPIPVTVAWLPIMLTVTPEAVFRRWVIERLDEVRKVAH